MQIQTFALVQLFLPEENLQLVWIFGTRTNEKRMSAAFYAIANLGIIAY
jgi:hypothetical protein